MRIAVIKSHHDVVDVTNSAYNTHNPKISHQAKLPCSKLSPFGYYGRYYDRTGDSAASEEDKNRFSFKNCVWFIVSSFFQVHLCPVYFYVMIRKSKVAIT